MVQQLEAFSHLWRIPVLWERYDTVPQIPSRSRSIHIRNGLRMHIPRCVVPPEVNITTTQSSLPKIYVSP